MFLKSNIAAIEVAGDEVRVAAVRVGGRLPEVLELHSAIAHYEDPAEREEALGRTLDQILERMSTRVVSYVSCASSARTIVRNVTIPFRGARRVAAAVKFELEPYLALPIEDLTVDFVQVGEFDGQTEVLAMGMRNDHLAAERAMLQAAGVEADAITVDAAALTGLWAALHPSKGLQAVLHLREHDSCVAIVYNKKLAFFRSLPYSAEQVESAPDALARDVANTLRAFATKWRGGGEVESLCVTGISLGASETEALSLAVGIPVNHEIMISAVPRHGNAAKEAGAHLTFNHWEALVGAAHAAASGSFHLDLTREEYQSGPIVRAAAGHVIFSCCLAFLLLCGWAFYYYQGTQQNISLASQLQDQTALISQEILALQENTLPSGVEPVVFMDAVLLEVLLELASKLPEDQIKVSEIRIASPNTRGSWITIEGEVGNSGQLVAVYNNLKSSRLLAFNAEPELRVQGAQTTFTIRADRPVAGAALVAAAESTTEPEAAVSEGAAEPAVTGTAEAAEQPAPEAQAAPSADAPAPEAAAESTPAAEPAPQS